MLKASLLSAEIKKKERMNEQMNYIYVTLWQGFQV